MACINIVDGFAARDAAPGSRRLAPVPPIKHTVSRRVNFVIPSEVEESRCIALKLAPRDVSTSLAMTNTTRRHFIKVSAASAIAIKTNSASMFAGQITKPLRILILGGTGFTGPYQVKYALTRGHKVTTFNRGKTHPGELPGEVEQLIGDRNGNLDALKNRKWDVVIDNPTTLPAWVRDAAQVLKGNVERYVFISTISVYADTSKGEDETAALAKYDGPDAFKETLEAMKASGYKTYGPLKALSEEEAEKWFPGKTLIIRPGLIVGPRDETDRFTYWPVRVDRGGEVLAPGKPDDPVQFIDARDLAEWTIRMAENRETGIHNATGPAGPLGIGGMLDGMKEALHADGKFTWVPADFLTEQKVEAWSDMPVWTGEESGMARTSISRALGKGLTFRPLAETTGDTLTWFKTLPAERQGKLRAGLSSEREKEVLTAWHKRDSG
jgi:2'-hydroxyisoflavone reductase